MCGICGVIDHKGGAVDEQLIRAMSEKMSHRGPDDSGTYINIGSRPHIGLGHRRLSIIDLSPLGHQPMSNEDGTVRVVFNGEIYNFKELKNDLESKGHVFRSHTDTETIVHLYEEFGEECVKHLRGMFAFAIWDDKAKRLILARDRIGKKPLIYFHGGGRFVFASEFTSLLESPVVPKKINRQALDLYLTFGYIPAPLTIYEDIFKLPPAHLLIMKNDLVEIKRYWELDYSHKIDISEEDASRETLRMLKEAVRIRLYSDVPLGAFLSGGIDSSAVVAAMSMESGSKIRTFSVGFTDKDYDELRYARNVANKFGTDHNEFIVKPDAMEILPLLVERYGEPYADSSCIPTYYVARETRRYVTVALNGDGGDESFAGYERYQAVLLSEIYAKAPAVIKAALAGLVSLMPDSAEAKNKFRRLKRLFDGIDLPIDMRYMRWLCVFDESLKRKIYSQDFALSLPKKDPAAFLRPYLGISGLDMIDRLLLADTNTYLPGDLLVKVDITSMANSLEARSPFLDHKFMEFAASLPAGYKMKNFVNKYILKKAVKGILPDENITRPKMGFGVPIGRWFRSDLKGFLEDSVLSKKSLGRGYFDPSVVRGIFDEHISGKKDHALRLWALLMLELWHKKFMD